MDQVTASEESLSRTLQTALFLSVEHLSPKALPAVEFVSDPIAVACVSKPIFSEAKISITSGLLVLLNEEELGSVLRAGVLRLSCRGLRRATLSASLARQIRSVLGFARLGSRSSQALTPAQVFLGWLIWPIYSIFEASGRPVDLFSAQSGSSENGLMSAALKASRVKKIHGTPQGYRFFSDTF